MMRKTLAVLTVATSLGAGMAIVPASSAAALTVYDPSNFAQNVLQATRALEQINNQIQALQNQAAMLQNMARHLQRLDYSSLGQITGALRRIDALMNQAQGIGFDLAQTDAAWRAYFPEAYSATVTTIDMVTQAQARWRTAMQAYRHTMRVQSQVVGNVQADSALLSDLVTRSQGAVGSLQAQQATNQLLALTTKQQLQVQNLMAAQYRADALQLARDAQAEEVARVATARFLGSGAAYTPR
jgi:P-type conjugative transfer protein TrbJ